MSPEQKLVDTERREADIAALMEEKARGSGGRF